MGRFLAMLTLVLPLALLAGPAMAQQSLSDAEARRLVSEYQAMKAQFDTIQKQVNELREQLIAATRQNLLLREELVHHGVDIEPLLKAAASQPENQVYIFDSPEAMAEFLRDNFTQRVRNDMTQLQRELGQKEFDSWLNNSAVLPTHVSWVFRVTDVWRADSPEKMALSYASDRQPLVPVMAAMTRTLSELELLELSVSRLRAEQKARRQVLDKRTRELTEALPAMKPVAERAMKQAYDAVVEINVLVRAADGKYNAQRLAAKPGRPSSQPEEAGYRLVIRARGARDESVELNVLCHERDAQRLMAAPRNSLIKIRGWLTDIALGERLATVGLRMDRGEVLAVNVEPGAVVAPPATQPAKETRP